jgi:K+-sensing histidine kinase KdpD
VVVVLAATGVRLAFNPVVGVGAPHMPFNLAVIMAAWFGGRGPGLAAAALSALGVDWFFLEPLHSAFIGSREGIWGFVLFGITTALIAMLVGSLRALLLARASAEASLQQQAHLIDLAHDGKAISPDGVGVWGHPSRRTEGFAETQGHLHLLHSHAGFPL